MDGFRSFLNEINPRSKTGFVGDIFSDPTVRSITGSFSQSLTGGLNFMNKFSSNLQSGALNVSGMLGSPTTLYMILGVGGLATLAYAYSKVKGK